MENRLFKWVSGIALAAALLLPPSAEGKVYLGIVGFNSRLTIKPIEPLTEKNQWDFLRFIDKLELGEGAKLYRAVDEAIEMEKALGAKYRDWGKSRIVTITTGFDSGSHQDRRVAGKYGSARQYGEAVLHLLDSIEIEDQMIEASAIGLTGLGGHTEGFEESLMHVVLDEELAWGAPPGQLATLLKRRALEIREEMAEHRYMKIWIPKLYPGSEFKFVFDGASPEKSQFYVAGSIRRMELGKFGGELGDIESAKIRFEKQDGIIGQYDSEKHQFRFNLGDFTPITLMFYKSKCMLYRRRGKDWDWSKMEVPAFEMFDLYRKSEDMMVVLVLDCSSSLQNDFETVKEAVRDFVRTLANPEK